MQLEFNFSLCVNSYEKPPIFGYWNFQVKNGNFSGIMKDIFVFQENETYNSGVVIT